MNLQRHQKYYDTEFGVLEMGGFRSEITKFLCWGTKW